jgi:LysM repeat protein
MGIELVKENIEYEQFLGENTADTVIKEEYIIPDTEPDVIKILMVDAKPTVLSKEVMQDKVYLEGQVDFDVLYLGKVDDKTEVCGVSYSAKFTNYVELEGAMHKMLSNAEANVEHMNCKAINERKIAIEGIIQLNSEVYSKSELDIVKDVEGLNNVQFLKNSTSMDRTVSNTSASAIAKSHMQIPMDKPQIFNILKCDVNIHKKQVRVLEGKIQMEAFSKVDILYKAKDTGNIVHLSDDVLINQEVEVENINPSMNAYADFDVDAVEYNVKEDDLGESRILDIEALIKIDIKVESKLNMEVIEDAYSPDLNIKIEKQNYKLNLIYGQSTVETIVKENIEINKDTGSPTEVIFVNGKVSITDKKLVEDKVLIEGIVKTSVIYRTDNDNINSFEEDVPFNISAEIPGSKIEMTSSARGSLENIEAAVEADTVAIKAILSVGVKVNYNAHKDFLVNIEPLDEEKPKKKASITIYTAQSGDTLWKIAKAYYTTIEDITRLNNIENPDYILPGQKLIIPGRAVV